jgi:hypothetical protein
LTYAVLCATWHTRPCLRRGTRGSVCDVAHTRFAVGGAAQRAAAARISAGAAPARVRPAPGPAGTAPASARRVLVCGQLRRRQATRWSTSTAISTNTYLRARHCRSSSTVRPRCDACKPLLVPHGREAHGQGGAKATATAAPWRPLAALPSRLALNLALSYPASARRLGCRTEERHAAAPGQP